MLFFVPESVLCDPKFCDWPKIDPKFITSTFENCLKSTKKARNLTILGFFLGTLEGTRTPDLLIRSAVHSIKYRVFAFNKPLFYPALWRIP